MSFSEILEQFDKALITENVKLKKIYNTLLRESEEAKPKDDEKKEAEVKPEEAKPEEKTAEEVTAESCEKVDENDLLKGKVHNAHKDVKETPVSEAKEGEEDEKKDDEKKDEEEKPTEEKPAEEKTEEEKKDEEEDVVTEALPVKKFFESQAVEEKTCPKCGKEVPDGKECGDGCCDEKKGLTPEQFYALKEKKEAETEEKPVEENPEEKKDVEEKPVEEKPVEEKPEEKKEGEEVTEAGGVKTSTKSIKEAPEVLEICKKMEDQELGKFVARLVLFDKYGDEHEATKLDGDDVGGEVDDKGNVSYDEKMKGRSAGVKELYAYAYENMDSSKAMNAANKYIETPELKDALMSVGYTEKDAERRYSDASVEDEIEESFMSPAKEANMKSAEEAGLEEKPIDPKVAGKTASEELPPDGEEALKETGVGAKNPDAGEFFGTDEKKDGEDKTEDKPAEEKPEEEKKDEEEDKKEEVSEAEVYETEVVEDPEAEAALEESIKAYMKENAKYFG